MGLPVGQSTRLPVSILDFSSRCKLGRLNRTPSEIRKSHPTQAAHKSTSSLQFRFVWRTNIYGNLSRIKLENFERNLAAVAKREEFAAVYPPPSSLPYLRGTG